MHVHLNWLRRYTLPSIALTVMIVLWGAGEQAAQSAILGVTIVTAHGHPATFADRFVSYAARGAEAALLDALLLFVLFLLGVGYRWWVVAAGLLLVGTPVALYSGCRIALYLWALNQGGEPWEKFVPQVIAVVSAWLMYIPVSLWLSRYHVVIVRRSDQRESPCPRCGYELRGSSGRCPECGWVVPKAVLDAGSK